MDQEVCVSNKMLRLLKGYFSRSQEFFLSQNSHWTDVERWKIRQELHLNLFGQSVSSNE